MAGGAGCCDAAARRTRSCREVTLRITMPRRSSGRSDHGAADPLMLPTPAAVCVDILARVLIWIDHE